MKGDSSRHLRSEGFLAKKDKCCKCPLFSYAWEDGKAVCGACNEIIAEIPYEDRLLDSAMKRIEIPEFCPIIEVESPLVNMIDVEKMLEDAAIISDGEYGGYCTEDIRLSEIPRIIEGA